MTNINSKNQTKELIKPRSIIQKKDSHKRLDLPQSFLNKHLRLCEQSKKQQQYFCRDFSAPPPQRLGLPAEQSDIFCQVVPYNVSTKKTQHLQQALRAEIIQKQVGM